MPYLDTLDPYTRAQAERLTPEVSRILRAHLDAGEHSKLRARLDTVTENVYRRLASGDYGRGDVRRAVLAALDANPPKPRQTSTPPDPGEEHERRAEAQADAEQAARER